MNFSQEDHDYAAKVMEVIGEPVAEFKPIAFFNRAGDCAEFFVDPDEYYAKRIDEFVTVYLSMKDDHIVGSMIKDVTRLCKLLRSRLPGFKIQIKDNRVQLEHVFRARLWTCDNPDDFPVVYYKDLAEITRRNDLETEAELCH